MGYEVTASFVSGLFAVGMIAVAANVPAASCATVRAPVYSAFDDASWAIVSPTVSTVLGQSQKTTYDKFIQECEWHSLNETKERPPCSVSEAYRLGMNAGQPISMKNYTELGFKKIRAPKEVFPLIEEFWKKNRDKTPRVEWDHVTPYHNTWQVPTSIFHVRDASLEGGGDALTTAISESSRSVLEEWTGQKLSGSSVYGIRIYQSNSILTPHVDRLPLVSSAIINVDQDTDEDWILEVYGHDGIAHNVTMKPGDMVLYESHSVIHGRPFPLKGRFYANIFVHFEVLGDINSTEKLPEAGGLPPYLLEGSQWEPTYRKENPAGWNSLSDLTAVLLRGDLNVLRYIAQREPSRMTSSGDPKSGWQPIHIATKFGHTHIVKFLVEEMNIDVNTPYFTPYGVTPFSLAMSELSGNMSHPTIRYLRERGGRPFFEVHGVSNGGPQSIQPKHEE